MRFTEHQDGAKRATATLLFFFLVNVALTVLMVNLMVRWAIDIQFGLLGLSRNPQRVYFFSTLFTVSTIATGCSYQLWALQAGGERIADLMGATPVVRGSENPLFELDSVVKLSNIVEEMALASGIPTPPLYIIDDDAINAFAAGWGVDDSIICVSTGACKRLTRNELQGVVAHEFSHIIHGDVKLNLWLSAMVFGLQAIFNLGLRLTQFADDTRGKTTVFVFFGLSFLLAGSIGWLTGRLLQAAICRQREYLADASAVQYTRDPLGIGGALRKIAHQSQFTGVQLKTGMGTGNLVSHMMLSPLSFKGSKWVSSHPSVAKRIRRLFDRDMPPLDSREIEASGKPSN